MVFWNVFTENNTLCILKNDRQSFHADGIAIAFFGGGELMCRHWFVFLCIITAPRFTSTSLCSKQVTCKQILMLDFIGTVLTGLSIVGMATKYISFRICTGRTK